MKMASLQANNHQNKCLLAMQNKRLHEKFPESSTGSGIGKIMTTMTCNAGAQT